MDVERRAQNSQNSVCARAFVLTASLASSAVVWFAVVNFLGTIIHRLMIQQ